MDNFLFIDKQTRISSAGLVNRIKWLLKTPKVGHCGTLDPLATGLLILCFGRATKLAQFVLGAEKTYEATITLGARSTTFDADGQITPGEAGDTPTMAQVAAAIEQFTGAISQRPPIYSAIKVAGRPLYEYARKQTAVEANLREVHVTAFEIIDYDYPRLRARIVCSTGTYIRSLANDLGDALGCGGYISELRRTAIGKHSVATAISVEELEALINENRLPHDARFQAASRTIEAMLELPVMNLSREREAVVEQGVPIRGDDVISCAATVHAHDLISIKSSQGRVLAIGRALCDAAKMSAMNGNPVFEYMRVI